MPQEFATFQAKVKKFLLEQDAGDIVIKALLEKGLLDEHVAEKAKWKKQAAAALLADLETLEPHQEAAKEKLAQLGAAMGEIFGFKPASIQATPASTNGEIHCLAGVKISELQHRFVRKGRQHQEQR
jgi:hypothetical protein